MRQFPFKELIHIEKSFKNYRLVTIFFASRSLVLQFSSVYERQRFMEAVWDKCIGRVKKNWERKLTALVVVEEAGKIPEIPHNADVICVMGRKVEWGAGEGYAEVGHGVHGGREVVVAVKEPLVEFVSNVVVGGVRIKKRTGAGRGLGRLKEKVQSTQGKIKSEWVGVGLGLFIDDAGYCFISSHVTRHHPSTLQLVIPFSFIFILILIVVDGRA